jgi:hypothetical protein
MNKLDLQQLAEDRIIDAQTLLDAGRWSAAYYIAGYAVECALKSRLAKHTREQDFPDKKRTLDAHTHSLVKLIELATLDEDLNKTQRVSNPALYSHWQIVKDWSEQSRYEQFSEARARQLYLAITDADGGVLPWIKKDW